MELFRPIIASPNFGKKAIAIANARQSSETIFLSKLGHWCFPPPRPPLGYITVNRPCDIDAVVFLIPRYHAQKGDGATSYSIYPVTAFHLAPEDMAYYGGMSEEHE